MTPIKSAKDIAVTADERKTVWSIRSFSGGCCGVIGIRPVAVGNVFRRLVAKAECYAVSRAVSHELPPIQLGVSVKGVSEAAVHAVCKFITNKIRLS